IEVETEAAVSICCNSEAYRNGNGSRSESSNGIGDLADSTRNAPQQCSAGTVEKIAGRSRGSQLDFCAGIRSSRDGLAGTEKLRIRLQARKVHRRQSCLNDGCRGGAVDQLNGQDLPS